MIRKLRIKCIGLCMASLIVVLVVVLGGINWLSYDKVVSDAEKILKTLSDNDGTFPQMDAPRFSVQSEQENEKSATSYASGKRRSGTISPETPYETRYFTVILSETGDVVSADIDKIAAIDTQAATMCAQQVVQKGTRGFFQAYRYRVDAIDGQMRVIFLDCGRSLSNFQHTLWLSVAVALAGLFSVLVLLILSSKQIIKPLAESYEKQKQFITDAGHEIKTPLTIISADADLLELEWGENEWLADIKRQTARLTGLTNDLIYLSKLEEEGSAFHPIIFPVSDVVEELGQSFSATARAQGKSLTLEVPPLISWTGDEKAMRTLVSVLLDNAIKYTPQSGKAALYLGKHGRMLRLTVINQTQQPVEEEKLTHLFDRFYRTEQSHNSQTGGHGLGLSIAHSIVMAHKGKITAHKQGTHTFAIYITMPA